MADPNAQNPFSVRVVVTLLAVAIVSFGALLVLAGWSPELRDRNTAGQHPFSTSAIGYNGLQQLLEAQGFETSISRFKSNLESNDRGIMVVTLTPWGMGSALKDYEPEGATLIVLPKWDGRRDWRDDTKMADTTFTPAGRLNDLLNQLDIDAEIGREDVGDTMMTPFGPQTPAPDVKTQVLRSDTLESVAETKGGGMLLARIPYSQTYILSDPDLINTFGLASIENARFTTGMFHWLQDYESYGPITLDATLHGFTQSENLLQMMFDVPFLGATLTALAAALLLGWAAFVRFGPPSREGRVIALGKEALADSSAGLVSMTRRETQMAPGYLALVRRRVAKDIGAPKTMTEDQQTALFDRLGPEPQSGKLFSQIEAQLKAPAANRDALMNSARELYRWRQGIIGRL
jgi:hypothetical protein